MVGIIFTDVNDTLYITSCHSPHMLQTCR